MYNRKSRFYFIALVCSLLAVGSGKTYISQFFEKTSLNESSFQSILVLKPEVKQELNNSVVLHNKGFLDDIKEGFEDVKEDAVDVGEDVKEDAVDVGEDVKDDAI